MRRNPTPPSEQGARSTRRPLASALAVLLGSALALVLTGTGAAGPSQQPVRQAPQSYYLALGDSITYGIDPSSPEGRPSAVAGYVRPFVARLRKLSPTIRAVNYGCPGESTVTFARGGCPWLAEGRPLHDAFRGSQLDAAVSFLRANPGEVSPITLTLWGNDLAPLSARGARARAEITAFARRFQAILRQLRTAAPAAEIIVTGAWNPEADRLAETAPLYGALDAAIARAAAGARARVANMAAVFNGSGNVRVKTARLCARSYACKGDPHPTAAGYRAMADAFLAASSHSRNP